MTFSSVGWFAWDNDDDDDNDAASDKMTSKINDVQKIIITSSSEFECESVPYRVLLNYLFK